ncbi:DNA mismatch repair protein MutS [Poriferisphaera sp. WC338]|uniref:DNA mismatch repair protein MutS n=1 Tax=Poriferisphaera sp. WC338 TaxID=3425129 RepID=UPI003D8133B6
MTTASTKDKPKKLTPAMQQFHRFKEKYPGTVLFFRMGDFYEMFYDDAKLAHRVLGVTLTERSKGQPMAGVPYHAVEAYIARMVKAGHRVAICDQMEDASQAKGVVRRDVTRVITPGTLTDEAHLESDQVNTLAAIVYHTDRQVSLAWAELSTGSFNIATLPAETAADELARIAPSELLFCEAADNQTPKHIQTLIDTIGCTPAPRPGWQFRHGEAIEILKRQYQVKTLQGFGLSDDDPTLAPASAVVHYLLETQCSSDTGRLAHLYPPRRFEQQNHLIIDQTSLRSLEVSQTLRSAQTEHSLLSTLQNCVTAMGKRTLRHWLCYPLCDREPIEQRQRVVEALTLDSRFLEDLREVLDTIHDVPRIIARLAVGRATPRDLVGLGKSASSIHKIEHLLDERPTVASYHERIKTLQPILQSLADQITTACIDTPPAHLREGGLIRDDFDTELDEYRSLQRDSHTWLAQYQADLLEQHDIPHLKVGYNKVFGYYIELSAVNRDKAPDAWTRKQTLKNAERFITPELKEFEGKALSAESHAISREQDLFAALTAEAAKHITDLQAFADLIAELDCLGCFALTAVKNRYVKPTITDDPVLIIEAGRHPVLDQLLGDQFVPNDTHLGPQSSSPSNHKIDSDQPLATLGLITGPNMAGKSTYIRQTALITLLAHTGSFVPADRAIVGLTDRIFTRIGASDELHTGQSTFMVEMTETANICHHATEKSLVILDEIGRGTSTLDGLSLAWAIAEFIAQSKPRTLFATHYHELTTLAEQYDNVTNLNVTVREWQDQIVFLHRIAPGSTNRSYGIHVAKIAGLPDPILKRASTLLSQLAVSHEGAPPTPSTPELQNTPTPITPQEQPATDASDAQMSLFSETIFRDHPAIEQLKELDMLNLTPLAAFDLLRKLHEQSLIDPNS